MSEARDRYYKAIGYILRRIDFNKEIKPYVDELESEKAELIKSLDNLVRTCKNFASNVSISKQVEVLNKFEEK